MSGWSCSPHSWFCNYWPGCRALLSHLGPLALSQLAPFHWSIRWILSHFAHLSNASQLNLRYLHYSENHLLEASPVKTVYAGPPVDTLHLLWCNCEYRCNSLSCPPGQLAPRGASCPGLSYPPPWLSSPPGGKLSRPVYLAPHPYRGNNLIWCFQFICNILWYLHVFLKL